MFRFLLIVISLLFSAPLSQEFFCLIFSRPLTLYKILLSDAKQVLIIECFVHAYVIRNVTLSYASRDMMSWVKENTPSDGSFLILTGREDVMTDAVQEWFPALAERHSASTLQGLEWTLGKEFYPRWNELSALQLCREMPCVESIASEMKLEYTYLIIDTSRFDSDFHDSFLKSGYTEIYTNGQYRVFEK